MFNELGHSSDELRRGSILIFVKRIVLTREAPYGDWVPSTS